MANTQPHYLLVSACILVTQMTKGAFGDITLAPLNRFVYEGATNTKITCESNETFLDWLMISFTGSSGVELTTNGELNPSFSQSFAVDHTEGTDVYTLVVFNATISPSDKAPLSTAGIYDCVSYATRQEGIAQLLVIRTVPICSSNFTQSTTMLKSGDVVQLSCTMIYGAWTGWWPIDAVMTWSMNGQPIPADNATLTIDSSSTEITASSTLLINENFDATYECETTFSQPGNDPPPFVANNAPDYHKTCNIISLGQPTSESTTAAVVTSTTAQETLTPCSPSSFTSNRDQCLPNLMNIAVYEGQLNTIMDLSTDPQSVTWRVLPSSDEFSGLQNVIDVGCNKNPSLAQLYDAYQTGLLIKNATTAGDPISTAGLYVGQCGNNPERTGAKLLVVRTGPQCSLIRHTINSTSSDISCSVTFADSTLHPIRPIVTWKLNGNYLASYTLPRKRIDVFVFFATSTITINSGSYNDNYQCELTFAAPTDIQYPWVATNAPTFKEFCSVNKQ